jgi:acetylornithine deacetylase/succinyl-diaminopimelate desuccinylase-like protein
MEKVGIPHFLMVPFGQPDMNEHSPQESLDIDFFMNGIKVTAATIDEFSRSDIGH